MYKFKKDIRKPTKKLINKQKREGKVVNIFGDIKTEVESKILFGPRYNQLVVKYIYQLFEKDENGEWNFVSKNEAENMVISKNPKSFRAVNLTKNIKGETNMKTLNNEYSYKSANNKINMLVRNDVDIIKKTSINALYDVLSIIVNVEIQFSDQLIKRQRDITQNEILAIKKYLDIPSNNKLKPSQINEIVICAMIEGYVNNDNKIINGYLEQIPLQNARIDLKGTSVHVITRGPGKSLKLMEDGTNYYLLNNVRNYDDMNNFFDYINIEISDGKNCVIETLKYIYQNYVEKSRKIIKMFKKELNQLEQLYNDENLIISYSKLVEFFEKVKLNYKILNFTNKKDYNSNIFDPKQKIFNFIVYNKHLYLIQNEKEFNNIKNSLDMNDRYYILSKGEFTRKINKLLKTKIKPKILKMDKDFNSFNANIYSFENDNKIYIKDDENDTQQKLLYLCQVFNINYHSFITESNFINEVMKQRNLLCQKSFYLYNHTSKEILYSEEVDDPENFITIDFNKYYSNILLSLSKIPIVNNLIHPIEKFIPNEPIQNDYIYSIEVLDEKYNLWFRNDDLYFGCILNSKYYKPMLEKMISENNIKIIDKIKVEWIDNYYKPILEELFNVVEKTENKNNISSTIKNIINRLIGKFNNGAPEFKEIKTNIHIEELNDVVNYHHNENENYYCYDTTNNKYKVFYNIDHIKNYSFNVLENHKPLRTLILNNSSLCMLKFTIDKNIDECDIIQINTDSITFRNSKYNPNQIDELDEIELAFRKKNNIVYNRNDEIYYNGKYNHLIQEITLENTNSKFNLFGVKIQDYKKISNSFIGKNNISFMNDIVKHNYKFEIILGYAGSGKSYKINNLIEHFINSSETYILLAPLLKVLKLYNKNINKNTIQYFTRNLKIPTETNIIIDEFYLIHFKDFRYIINWLYSHNKNIYLFGDKYQLPPITPSNINTSNTLNFDFIKSISTKYIEYSPDDKNFRNNFDFQVYRDFIKNDYTIQQQKNIINYFINERCDISKKYINICYRNDIKDKINYESLCNNNQIFSKDKIQGNGIPIIAKKNYKINDDIIICSKDEYILDADFHNNKYILSFDDLYGNTQKFQMEPDKIFKLFDVAYCLNLYNIQGQTLSNFKFILDDVYFLNKDNCYNIKGAFYTLISRIKEPLSNEKISPEFIKNIINNIISNNNNNNNNTPIYNNIKQKLITQNSKKTKISLKYK